MAMSLAQAQAELHNALRQMEEVARMSAAIYAQAERIEQRLNAVKGSGIEPNKMPSTVALAAEFRRNAEGQRHRAAALVQGIGAVIG